MTNEYDSGIVEAVSLGGFRQWDHFRGRNQTDIKPQYVKPAKQIGYDFGPTIDDAVNDGIGGIVDLLG